MNQPIHSQKILKDRVDNLIKALANGIYEREPTIRLCLLATLAGESVFLLGPPGIAKSLIAKRLIQAFDKASFFDYLMTRFSTPEEVFGPLSIKELKDHSNYVRLTEGYLPSADVVFLDEIWKAGPAILNTLLTVINERTFKNGQNIMPIPMRLLITASNELPDKESGLEALYDRILIRLYINRIQDKKNFQAMLSGDNKLLDIPASLAIKSDEFTQWQSEIKKVKLNQSVFEQIYYLKQQLENNYEQQHVDFNNIDLYVSDRRWKKSIQLLKTSAYFNGRDEIISLDLFILKNCLWNTLESRQTVEDLMDSFASKKAFDQHIIQVLMDQALQKSLSAKELMQANLKTKIIQKTTRLKSKPTLDFSNSKSYLLNNKPMVKLILLDTNSSISDTHKGDSEWVYINADEFNKALQNGKCEIYGYINNQPKIGPLQFTIDAHNNLMIQDISNRSIPVCIVNKNNPELANLEDWKTLIKSAYQDLEQAELMTKSSLRTFHNNLPHNFVDERIILITEASFNQLTKNRETIKIEIEKNTQRILNINTYFDDNN